jgi:hypothetical protein
LVPTQQTARYRHYSAGGAPCARGPYAHTGLLVGRYGQRCPKDAVREEGHGASQHHARQLPTTMAASPTRCRSLPYWYLCRIFLILFLIFLFCVLYLFYYVPVHQPRLVHSRRQANVRQSIPSGAHTCRVAPTDCNLGTSSDSSTVALSPHAHTLYRTSRSPWR